MREIDLPSPGTGAKGYHLRRVATQAISEIQRLAPAYTDKTHPSAAALKAFFVACAAKVDLYSSASPTDDE